MNWFYPVMLALHASTLLSEIPSLLLKIHPVDHSHVVIFIFICSLQLFHITGWPTLSVELFWAFSIIITHFRDLLVGGGGGVVGLFLTYMTS